MWILYRSDRYEDQGDPPRGWAGVLQHAGSGRRVTGLVAAICPSQLSSNIGKGSSIRYWISFFLPFQRIDICWQCFLIWQSSGRLTVPYVLLYYLPENCNPSSRMMYAGAVELMRNTAEVNRVIEIESESDVLNIESKLTGSDWASRVESILWA